MNKLMTTSFILLLLMVVCFSIYSGNSTKIDESVVVIEGESDVVIENEQYRLIVGNNAIAKSLVLKSTNEECLMQGENIALFSVTQERPYHNELKLGHPNKRSTYQADTVYREGENLIVGFELIPYQAVIKIKETPSYIGFTLHDFITDNIYPDYLKITPPPATELTILQLPIRDRDNFGEWLNVSWDENAAINVLGTDVYASIDFEKRNGFKILKATAIKDIKFKGTGAALIVTETDNLLNNIAQVEEDFILPKGVEGRRNDLINASYYWTGSVNPENVDQHIKYAKLGGFRLMSINYTSFEKSRGYRLIGNYEIDEQHYPNGKDDLREMLDKIKAAGITPGIHILHSHIGRDSKYVTPVPDYRLNIVKSFNLSENLGMNDTIIYVEQNPEGTTMADGCRVLRVGTELISFDGYTTTWPYKFSGCIRGIDDTTINSAQKGSFIGILDVSEFGATSVYINQQTSLQDEVAEKIADIYDAGFKFVYFDGSEGVNPPFGINVALAQYRVFKHLNPQPIFAEGAAKTHFSWHMLSGGNAFDVFRPEDVKQETRNWPAEEAPRMLQDFTRLNFGWLGYRVPDETTVGTQPDMLEYVSSVAAGWDCPISIQSNLQAFESHPRTTDNMEVIRRWEEVRTNHWLTDQQKEELQNSDQEHHLLINEVGGFELVPYYQIINAAGLNNKEIRAFIFERKGDYYVTYWHISGDKQLVLPVSKTDANLFRDLLHEEMFKFYDETSIIIPANDRRYIKFYNKSREQIIEILENAKIID
ncbi:MAG: hypothetical protein PHQ67_06225 [Fermentimonas sp.]|nr:hypothetical protein [Fermentimonas sp.]